MRRMTSFWPAGFLTLLLLGGVSFPAQAGWWHRCRCSTGTSSSGFSAAAPVASGFTPAQAPAAAPAQAAAPAYYYYYPGAPAAAPAQAAPAGSQAFLSEIRDVIEIVKVIREVAGGLVGGQSGGGQGGGGDTRVSGNCQVDLSGVTAALSRIETGQADLRGRLINNAGISRAIGEKLVDIDSAIGPQGRILLKLDELDRRIAGPIVTPSAKQEVTETSKTAESDKAPVPPAAIIESTVSRTEFDNLKSDVASLKEELPRLNRIETMVTEMHGSWKLTKDGAIRKDEKPAPAVEKPALKEEKVTPKSETPAPKSQTSAPKK